MNWGAIVFSIVAIGIVWVIWQARRNIKQYNIGRKNK